MSKPTAKLYFNRSHTNVAVAIATQIRNEGNHCNLIYAAKFRDQRDVEEKCSAIAIQVTAPNALKIARIYKQEKPDIEVHYFDDEGNFCDPPGALDQPAADPFASLRKKEKIDGPADSGSETPKADSPVQDETPTVEAAAPSIVIDDPEPVYNGPEEDASGQDEDGSSADGEPPLE